MGFERIEFKSFDGFFLRGNFYSAKQQTGPCVILTQGLGLLKEHFIDKFAARFQAAGISALVYDHRGYGSSEGSPRGEYDMWRLAEGYHDAVSYVSSRSDVDPARICLWGIGHSGGISILASSIDPRVKAVILCMPLTSGKYEVDVAQGLLEKAFADRAASASSKEDKSERTYMTLWPTSEAQALAEDKASKPYLNGALAWEFTDGCRKRSNAVGTEWIDKITLQSFYHISRVEPADFIARIAPLPLLYIAAEKDPLTGTLERHKAAFDRAGEPKEFKELGNNRLATYMYENDTFDESVATQIDFVKRRF